VKVTLEVDDAALDRLADAIAARIQPNGATSPWLTATEAAEYLRAPVSRVRKLTLTGDPPTHRDGRRVLYRRDELDAYIARGGALSP
jgi:excisionase family DNA binding protein